ncbi:hypothetical protein DSUL_50133 [Desulfovibrionales bacterium]
MLANAYIIQAGLAVYIHVHQLSRRLRLTAQNDTRHIEPKLMALFFKAVWGEVNHLMVFFGWEICRARSSRCSVCKLLGRCPRSGWPRSEWSAVSLLTHFLLYSHQATAELPSLLHFILKALHIQNSP